MNYKDLAMMSADELWSLHEEVRTTLSTKLDSEKQELERRLALLNGRAADRPKARRPYPKVHPKYRNPERPSETWSGRGRQPHALKSPGYLGDSIPERFNCEVLSDREASSSFAPGSVPRPFELRREAFADRDNDLLDQRRKASVSGSLTRVSVSS